MFGRRILAAVAFVAAYAKAQNSGLSITNPSPTSWWVSGSENTLAWTCNTSPYSAYTVVLSNTDKTILSAPLALIANVPNFDCSFTVNQQQSTLATSPNWVLSLTDIQNITNIYASTQFEVKAAGSVYPTTTSSSASSGSATGTAGSASSTGTSGKSNGAAANVVPVGMTMAAALVLGLVVA